MNPVTRADIEATIKQLLVEHLQVDATLIAEAGPDTPLLGRGLGLDSIEAMQLGLQIESAFNIRIPDAHLTEELFARLGTLTEYVHERASIRRPAS